MAKVKWNLPNFNAMVNGYAAKVDQLDDVAYECIKEAQTIQYDAMIDGLKRHKKTGDAISSREKKPIQRDANRTYTDLSIELNKGNNDGAFWGAWAQEYGSRVKKSGKVRFKKDPWMRPAIDGSKNKIEKAWRGIMQKRGFPMK